MARSASNYRTGVAATELAILLPLLILLCLAAVDFGRYARAAIELENAVRAGAEFGAGRRASAFTYDSWELAVKEHVQSEFGADSVIESLDIDVSLVSLTDDLPRVAVTGEYTFETIVPWGILPESIVIHRQTSMLRYR